MNIIENFIIGLSSSIVTIIIYMINVKIEKEETNNKNLIKVSLLGFFLGIFSCFISKIFLTQVGGATIMVDQDIHVGQPNF
jgi:hypothetical protein